MQDKVVVIIRSGEGYRVSGTDAGVTASRWFGAEMTGELLARITNELGIKLEAAPLDSVAPLDVGAVEQFQMDRPGIAIEFRPPGRVLSVGCVVAHKGRRGIIEEIQYSDALKRAILTVRVGHLTAIMVSVEDVTFET